MYQTWLKLGGGDWIWGAGEEGGGGRGGLEREGAGGGDLISNTFKKWYRNITLTLTEFTIDGNKKTYSSSLLSESIGMSFGSKRCFSIVGLPLKTRKIFSYSSKNYGTLYPKNCH
jgi:hypothetical protein